MPNHFCSVGAVAHHQPALGGDPVDDQVVQDGARLVASAGVEGLAVDELAGGVGHDVIHQGSGARPGDFNLAHVGHIKQPGGLSHCQMLLFDALILDR